MADRQKGFTLVEVIVVLVILAMLLAIMIPAMTGWIDKAKEQRLIITCQACVTAAQTLVAEKYGVNEAKTPPDGAEVVDLTGVTGVVSGISLNPDSNLVDTLKYTEKTESVTYFRLPSPHYLFTEGITVEVAAASSWAKGYLFPKGKANEQLTKQYGYEKPPALTKAQMELIFGKLEPVHETQYIYPMAIMENNDPGNKKVLDIQYVTPHNPSTTDVTGRNRYQASAFIIDGKTYICTQTTKGKVNAILKANPSSYFQSIMNTMEFESEAAFVEFITTDGGYYKLAE